MCFGGQRKGMYGNKPSQETPVWPDEALRFGRQNSFWSKMRVISVVKNHFGAKCNAFRSSKIILSQNAMLFGRQNSFWGEMQCFSVVKNHFGAKCNAFRSSKFILERNAMLFGLQKSFWSEMQCFSAPQTAPMKTRRVSLHALLSLRRFYNPFNS